MEAPSSTQYHAGQWAQCSQCVQSRNRSSADYAVSEEAKMVLNPMKQTGYYNS
jgi:hypothetical protein